MMSARRAKKKKLSVLFVCTGNTCRSPLAETAFRKLLQRNELDRLVEVSSAGLMARDGARASSMAVQVASDRGLDLSPHRSRQLTKKIFKSADMLIGMQRTHLLPLEQLKQAAGKELLQLGPFHSDRKLSTNEEGIRDPFGGGRKEYEHVFDTILSCLDGLLEYLRNRVALERESTRD
ncbi:MAG: low molecular weight protein arginine phosphatase [Candidatus Glassbacteria bacterium]|nr:low molecular weight protein arginine phosphatase [Candidatus Glassbacteria bacterium]